jgi:hypothetical protein
MAFEKGNPGRPIGSKNKMKQATELFESLSFNPLADAIAQLKLLPDGAKKTELLLKIAEFVFVKPKSVEMEVTGLDSLVIVRAKIDELPRNP